MKKQIKLKSALWLIILAAAVAAAVSFLITTFYFNANYGDTLKSATEYSAIVQAAGTIGDKFIGDVDKNALTEGAIEGMLGTLDDRWSYYVNQDELQTHMENANNSYVGIGVTVRKDDEAADLVITEVIEGGSAYDAGIQVGDVILSANGDALSALTLADAKALIVGEEGTYVSVTVQKADGTITELTLQRVTVNIPPAKGEMIGNIGYITIANFDANAADSFISEVERLADEGAEGFVFDVRFNGGGRLSELMDMLDFLLPEGIIFRTNTKGGQEELSYSDASCFDMPMAVLVNDSSYSAAEFFAAALGEYDWATVVGQHTTGKGYSQSSFQLDDGTILVLSTKEYRTPDGVSLAGVGIAPDITLDISDEEYANLYYKQLAVEDDSQLQAALQAVMAEIK